MDIRLFKGNLHRFATLYNPKALFSKIGKVAKNVGVKTIYGILVLYYATFDKSLPIKDRIMVTGALGYFILPLDFIPDAFPGGFSDDAAAIAYVLRHIWKNLSEATFAKARKKLTDWFPDSLFNDLESSI